MKFKCNEGYFPIENILTKCWNDIIKEEGYEQIKLEISTEIKTSPANSSLIQHPL